MWKLKMFDFWKINLKSGAGRVCWGMWFCTHRSAFSSSCLCNVHELEGLGFTLCVGGSLSGLQCSIASITFHFSGKQVNYFWQTIRGSLNSWRDVFVCWWKCLLGAALVKKTWRFPLLQIHHLSPLWQCSQSRLLYPFFPWKAKNSYLIDFSKNSISFGFCKSSLWLQVIKSVIPSWMRPHPWGAGTCWLWEELSPVGPAVPCGSAQCWGLPQGGSGTCFSEAFPWCIKHREGRVKQVKGAAAVSCPLSQNEEHKWGPGSVQHLQRQMMMMFWLYISLVYKVLHNADQNRI